MRVDYGEIGKRIARRRKKLNLRQAEVEERADISYKYLSNIERGVSIPSTEVIMRLAIVLKTTPDEFLVGALHGDEDQKWLRASEQLRGLTPKQLALTEHFLDWVKEENI